MVRRVVQKEQHPAELLVQLPEKVAAALAVCLVVERSVQRVLAQRPYRVEPLPRQADRRGYWPLLGVPPVPYVPAQYVGRLVACHHPVALFGVVSGRAASFFLNSFLSCPEAAFGCRGLLDENPMRPSRSYMPRSTYCTPNLFCTCATTSRAVHTPWSNPHFGPAIRSALSRSSWPGFSLHSGPSHFWSYVPSSPCSTARTSQFRMVEYGRRSIISISRIA